MEWGLLLSYLALQGIVKVASASSTLPSPSEIKSFFISEEFILSSQHVHQFRERNKEQPRKVNIHHNSR